MSVTAFAIKTGGRATAILACALLLAACGGGGGGGGGGAVPQMTCGGTVPAGPDLVRFDCPASSGSPMAVRVVIGPTTSIDIYTVKFDVVFNPAVVNFDPPAIEGNFLDQDGKGTAFAAGTQPGDPGRLVVSVTRLGPVAGVGVASGEKSVITLPFLGVGAGTTGLAFENAEAKDSNSSASTGIQFSGPVDVTSP